MTAKRVLITGGSGFIGQHLVAEFSRRGDEPCAFDLQPPADGEWFEGDVRVAPQLHQAIIASRPDIVFHLAALAEIAQGTSDVRLDFETGALGALNVLDECRRHELPVVMISSGAVWELPYPPREDDGPMRPISMYGASKLAAEAFTAAFAASLDLQALTIRFGNIVGGGMTYGVIHDLLHRLIESKGKELHVRGDGTNRRGYLLVDDAVKALADLSNGGLAHPDHPQCVPAVVNIASPDSLTVGELVAIQCQELGVSPVLSFDDQPAAWPGDSPHSTLDISLARSLGVGLRPSVESVRIASRRLADEVGAFPR